MAQKKSSVKTAKRSSPKKSTVVKPTKRRFSIPHPKKIGAWLVRPFVKMYRTLRRNRQESAHKSFLRTRGRDKIRKPKIEGFLAFPWYVFRVLWKRRWVYLRFVALYVVMSIAMVGASQISNIGSVNQVIDTANGSSGVIGPVLRAAMTVGTTISGALNNNFSDVQYLYMSALYILSLLTIIWLVRQQLAGNKVVVRDGLYNASAPIASEYVLAGIGIAQLVPAALAVLVYMSATSLGLLEGGIETAMFSVALFLVVVLTLYFMTTTLFAMFIASIPGTYPLHAYRAARRIVAGQRMRLLFRLLWLVIVLLLGWFVVLVPIIIIVNSFVAGSGSAVIPVAVQIMTGASFVYGTAYAYLLYRRMIDDPVAEN